jgi:hypothetical protein
MSGKRNKERRRAERKLFQELDDFIGPMREEALEELDHDMDDFLHWTVTALTLHKLFPEIPSKFLLPSNIDETLEEIGGVLSADAMSDLTAQIQL